MNHIFAKLEQLAQLVCASLVLILAINLVRAIVEPQAAAAQEPAARTLVPAETPLSFRKIALRPAEMQSDGLSALPMLVTAAPGQAHVFAEPGTLVQVQVESPDHVCARTSGASDANGRLSLPVAATRNCAHPRVVVMH